MTYLRVDEDITLRPLELADAETVFDLIEANREHLGRWIPPLGAVASVEEERDFIRARLAADDGQEVFAIVYRGDIVGGVGVHPPARDDTADIGYWLAEDRQGRGIVTRSVAAVLDHVFDERGLRRVRIRAAVDNVRSRAIPERLGFRLEGVELKGGRLTDGYADMAVYAILAPEWRARREG